MKRLILTCSFLAAACVVSFGQSVMSSNPSSARATQKSSATHKEPSAEATAEKQTKVYQQQLGLTKDQYKAVYAAELEYQQQIERSIADFGSAPGPGQTSQMQMTKDMKIKSVLTAEQNTKYEAGKGSTAAPASH